MDDQDKTREELIAELAALRRRLAHGGAQRWPNNLEHERRAQEVIPWQLAAMETSIDGMAILNAQGEYFYLNRAHAQIYGYQSAEELLGQSWRVLYDERELERFDAEVMPRLQREGHWRGEAIGRRKDGSSFPQELSLTALPDGGIICVVHDISQRRRAQAALRESEEKFRRLVESMDDIIFTLDGEQRHTGVYGRWLQRFNSSPAVYLGKTAREVLGDEVAPVHEEANRRALLGESVTYQWSAPGAGGPNYFETSLSPLRDPTGVVVGIVGVGRDITALRQAEGTLAARAQQQEAVAQLGQRALADPDLDRLLTEASRLLAETLGVEYSKVLELLPGGEELLLRAGVGWREGVVGQVRVGAGRDSQAGYTLLCAEPVIVADLANETRFSKPPLLWAHGVVSGISVVIPGGDHPFGVLSAHTRQRRAFTQDDAQFLHSMAHVLAQAVEHRRAEAESERLARFPNENPNPVMRLSREGIILYANEASAPILAAWKLKAGATLPHDWTQRVAEVLDAGTVHTLEMSMDGRVFALTLAPIVHGGYVNLYALNITAQKRGEESLRESERRFREMIENAGLIAILLDIEGRILFCNDFLLSLTGWKREEIWGRNWTELFIPAEMRADLDTRLFVALRDGQVLAHNENEILTRAGERRLIRWSNSALRDREGAIIGMASLGEDITERKHLEEQLRQVQKMETVGRLAGGVAHDFNNLLTAIGGYGGFVRDALPAGSPIREDIEQVLKAAERAAGLTHQLLAFSRRQIIAPKVLNLNDLILDMDKMLRRLIGEDVELVTLPAPDLGAIKADAGQLEQVLVNLAVNARDAMPQGGKLTIETANVTLDEDYARRHLGAKPGEHVLLAISDTGTGMSAEVKEHLFEPFYTTKEVGKGTGLGLATVYGIIKQHGGNIWVYSELGQGTAFKIYFPRTDAPAERLPRKDDRGYLPRGDETILLVEDEAMVRGIALRILSDLGYHVLEAANGSEALRLAAQYRGEIHLLFTDVVMPQMGGKELATRLHALRPSLRTLFVSGYTDNAIVHRGILDEGVAFMQKPFTASTLARKVREMLDR